MRVHPDRVNPVDERLAEALEQRSALVDVCLRVRDEVPSPVLAATIDQGLTSVGVQIIDPTGEPFDAEQHLAVDRAPTVDPAQHDRVAGTEKPGVVDGGRTLQRPEVVVYRHEGEAR